MKQIAVTPEEIAANMTFSCAYTETQGSYGTVQVDASLTASHTKGVSDADDVFSLEDGMLKMTTDSANGTDYALKNGVLSVNSGFTGTITASVAFDSSASEKGDRVCL